MRDEKIIDLSERLHQRLAGQAKDKAYQLVREHFREAFQILAEQHGLSDAWAAEKAAIATAVVSVLARPLRYNITLKLSDDLDDAQQAAISAAVDQWAREFGERVVSQCLEAFGGRLLELALP